jgi:SET domain-containing protein
MAGIVYQSQFIPYKGLGLVAPQPIPQFTFIGKYMGKLVRKSQINKKSDYAFECSDGIWYVDPSDAFGKFTLPMVVKNNNYLPFVNEPNLGTQANLIAWDINNQILYFAARYIQAGEELTVSYGENYKSDYTKGTAPILTHEMQEKLQTLSASLITPPTQ